MNEVFVKRENYAKYGKLLMASSLLFWGTSLLIAATKYFSSNTLSFEETLKRMYVASAIVAFAIIISAYLAYSIRKKNKIKFQESKEELSQNVNSFVGYLKSTYLWRLIIYSILAIPLVLSTPWLASRRSLGMDPPTIFLYFAIIGVGIVFVTLPLIFYYLFKK